MSPKPPNRSTTTVEVDIPRRPLNEPPLRADSPPRLDGSSSLWHPQKPRESGRASGDADLDAITPVPSVTIRELQPPAPPPLSSAHRPLDDYRIASAAHLPTADAQGFRTFKGRLFVDVFDAGTVPVGQDPDSGLYRAKLPNELQASGPMLVRDPDSTLWHRLDDLESMTFSLTATRLEAFRTQLDFTGVDPDSKGLHQHDGKLYAVIEDHAYQVLHDRDASSAQVAVMRIVRPEDPIALDADNLYVATRPGRSEAVIFNVQTGWTGLVVGGAGGMWSGPNRSGRSPLATRLSALVGLMNNPRARVRKLFPSFDHEQVTAFIQSLGDDVAGGLTRRETEYATLKQQLRAMKQENTRSSSDASAKEILRCWRRETGTTFTLAHEGVILPALRADFSHIETLELKSINWSTGADTFLDCFPTLKNLSITQSRLEKLPASINDMPQLTSLDLHSNRITLDEQSALRLSALGKLENIDLSGNALGILPDFSNMSGLKMLNLRRTGIDQWPTGLQNQNGLDVVDLRNNRLKEVPQTHFNPPVDQLEVTARINNVTLLEGNAFPADYWQHFDSYWQRLGRVHPNLLASAKPGAFYCADPRIERWQRMFPDNSLSQARLFIFESGARVETELVRLEREFNSLEEHLSAWSFSGGGTHQRYVRANQIRLEHGVVADRYEARNRILKCWRRETPQMLANDGTPIGLELDLSGLILPSLPDLDVDFSHVGSLKLNNMYLSASPEGFLSRFRHVRWLDLSNNQLRDLPPAVGEMHSMTRLFLQKNQIILTPETAGILSGRVTLRALILSENPLGIAPDFSQITDMRSLYLSSTNIENWPTGLGEQSLLDRIELSGNRITTIPDSVIAPPDERLAHTARLNDVTNVSRNPLSDATLEQVRQYGDRLIAAGVTAVHDRASLVATARIRPISSWRVIQAEGPFRRWKTGLSEAQISARKAQWQALSEQLGADSFFEILNRLDTGGTEHADLQRRVWAVLDTISENSPQSEKLRREMFDRAGEPTCCDRAAFSFSNLEIMSLVYKARTQAMDQTQGLQLSTLSRGLFRLHEVDKFASADIQRSEAIVNDPTASAALKQRHRPRLGEEIEIRLAYRFGLKDRLQLPGQPEHVNFISLGKVTPQMLNDAYKKIIALDNSPEERHALLSRDFWLDYVTNKYRLQFEAQSKPYQERLANLHERLAAEQITEAVYKVQSDDLQAQLAIEEAELMQKLTQQELVEPPLSSTTDSVA
ncbi:NEL-type E3 ubiquitin ligase domain-containing protein [Pseudomonas sp.]|uniref:NEL-type E3 ubiquitin ligase domain-containing protein n=1 Tax=Pseudomonas sp. TaxID=306 RepID=UPI003F4164CF